MANQFVRIPASEQPTLITTVDAEEEFDWTTFSASADSVTNIRQQSRAQEIFLRHKLVPTYLVDYPVASIDGGYQPLRELQQDGLCEIGAQLHPWVNPPFEETVSKLNSYANNLPAELERAKIQCLRDEIRLRFDVQPTVYRAGRHGFGANTAQSLCDLGFRTDSSVLPRTDLRPSGGPDFSQYSSDPFRFGPGNALLELPQTLEMLGLLRAIGPAIYKRATNPVARYLKMPGILAKLGLVNRIRLTPEGVRLSEAKWLTRALLARGHRVFVMSYHSSSLSPGHTPYTPGEREVGKLLDWLESYITFFLGEIGGRLSTADEYSRKLATGPQSDTGAPSAPGTR